IVEQRAVRVRKVEPSIDVGLGGVGIDGDDIHDVKVARPDRVVDPELAAHVEARPHFDGERTDWDLVFPGPHAVSDGETGAERGPAINAGVRPAVLATVFLRHAGAEFPWSVLDFAGEPGVQGHLRDRGALAHGWLA